MQTIKVLLASRPKMLSDVIKNLIDSQQDMELLGEVFDPIELLIAVRTTQVDAVIVTPLDLEVESRICHHLLAQNPQLKIVTLSAKGDAAFLYELNSRKKYIDEPSGQSILGAIRDSFHPSTSKST
jgi:DNA-binding NarL/FixJ family response regulator